MNNDAVDLAKSICEEFCNTTLIDPENGSILLYIPKKYYSAICYRLINLDFIEIFKYKQKKYYVCLFQILTDLNEDIEVWDDEDDDDIEF